jgi:hypothetical protein
MTLLFQVLGLGQAPICVGLNRVSLPLFFRMSIFNNAYILVIKPLKHKLIKRAKK